MRLSEDGLEGYRKSDSENECYGQILLNLSNDCAISKWWMPMRIESLAGLAYNKSGHYNVFF